MPLPGRARPRLLAALAAAVALILLGGPLVLGGRAQQAYQNLLGDLLEALPPGWVVVENYDRGWFGAKAHTELAFRPGLGGRVSTPLRVRLESRVSHGPLHWLTAFPPVIARAHTRAEILDLPAELPPLLVGTDIGIDGRALARLQVPAGEWAGQNGAYRLRNGELRGSLRFEPQDRRILTDIQLPDLALLAPGGTLAGLSGLSLEADLAEASGAPAAGRAHLAIESAQAGAAEAGKRLEELRLAFAQTPRDGNLDLRIELAARSFGLGGTPFQNARMTVSADALDTHALAELAEGVKALASDAVSPAMRGLVGAALVARLLPRLAVAGPRLDIDPLRVDTADGPAAGRLRLGLDALGNPGDPVNPFASPSAWIRALSGDGELELPESLALQWLARLDSSPTGSGLANGGDGEMAQERIQPWIEAGWVSLRDGRLASDFRLTNGLLTVNGKTFPLFRVPGPLTAPGRIDGIP